MTNADTGGRMTHRVVASAGMARTCSVLLAAAMFAWPALLNHYPLVFNDTARYVDGGIRHYIPSEAPIFYGIFMIPLHFDGWSLWPVALVQCVIIAYSLRLTLRALDLLDETSYLAVCAFLATLTGAPWFATLIMPDVFTAVAILGMFVLFRGWETLNAFERLAVAGLTLLALASHVTHILIGLCIAAVAILLGSFGRRRPRAAFILVPLLPAIALAAVIGMNVVAKGRVLVTQDGNVFVFARAFADGPAREYLQDNCPERQWRLCRIYASLPPDPERILWGRTGSVWSAGSRDEVRAEAGTVAREAIQAHPTQMLAAAAHNGAAQLLTFQTGVDFGRWGDMADTNNNVGEALLRLFPGEVGEFLQASQQQGKLDLSRLNRVYSTVIVLSLAGAVAIMAVSGVPSAVAEFAVVLGVGIVANAIATGAFAAVHDRYQARVIWLVPLLFAVCVLAYRRRRIAGPPGTQSRWSSYQLSP